MNWITDNIAVGDWMDSRSTPTDAILNMAIEELGPIDRTGKEYLNIKTYDRFKFTDSQLDLALSFIHGVVSNNKTILVHCIAGISRSPSIVATYLAIQKGSNFDKELNEIYWKRSQVDPAGAIILSCRDYVERKQKSVQ